jgi:hypothetical protein
MDEIIHGIQQIDRLNFRESCSIVAAWRRSFIGAWRGQAGEPLWHAFSFHAAACVRGSEAKAKISRLSSSEVFVWTESAQTEVDRLSGTLSFVVGSPSDDIYIYDRIGSWMAVMTHEADIGLGPYFAELDSLFPLSQ